MIIEKVYELKGQKSDILADFLEVRPVDQTKLVRELGISHQITKFSALEYLQGLTSLLSSFDALLVLLLDNLNKIAPSFTKTQRLDLCEVLKYLTDPFIMKRTLTIPVISPRVQGIITNLSPPLRRRFFFPTSHVVQIRHALNWRSYLDDLAPNINNRESLEKIIDKVRLRRVGLLSDFINYCRSTRTEWDLIIYANALKWTSELLDSRETIAVAVFMNGLQKALNGTLESAKGIFRGNNIGLNFSFNQADSYFLLISNRTRISLTEDFEEGCKTRDISEVGVISIEIETKILPKDKNKSIREATWQFEDLVGLVIAGWDDNNPNLRESIKTARQKTYQRIKDIFSGGNG